MKQTLKTCVLTIVIPLIIFCSCKKNNECNQCQPQKPPAPNKPPIAVAGPDQTIFLPTDSVLLNGFASYDPEGKSTESQWKKVSGPSSFSIVNPNSNQTQVKFLTEGVYQFELSIADILGFVDKDTTIVTVKKAFTNEIIFTDRSWVCYGGCYLETGQLSNIVPAGNPIKVFIRRDNSSVWVEANSNQSSGAEYVYWVENGYLMLFTLFAGSAGYDTPDVKVLY